MKRFFIWAGILASLLGPANAAGTVPGFSLTPQFDSTGKVMPGCRLYTIQAGTTQTPQNSYQDTALTILQPNPLLCDSTGRLPQWFVADGQIKVRLTNTQGIQQFVGDNLLVVGASSGGGGGGGTVDPTTIIATGDVKYRYGTGVLTGFVRANGRTIGSATSGATERANADAQPLFEYLWNTDPNLAVSTGRGASANADWVANKTIVLPDFRGRLLVGPDGMGNSQAGRIGSGAGSFGANNDTLGKAGGAEVHTLTAAQIPTITSINSNAVSISVTSSRSDFVFNTLGLASSSASLGGANSILTSTAGGITSVASSGSVAIGQIGSTSINTSGVAHDTMPPAIIVTTYMKL